MKEYKKISVLWKDITFFNYKIKEKDLSRCVFEKVETTGYLIREDKSFLVIALSIYDDERFGDFYLIPKCNIIKRSFLKEVKK